MASKALEILKNGIEIFEDKINDRKAELNAKLSQNECSNHQAIDRRLEQPYCTQTWSAFGIIQLETRP